MNIVKLLTSAFCQFPLVHFLAPWCIWVFNVPPAVPKRQNEFGNNRAAAGVL